MSEQLGHQEQAAAREKKSNWAQLMIKRLKAVLQPGVAEGSKKENPDGGESTQSILERVTRLLEQEGPSGQQRITFFESADGGLFMHSSQEANATIFLQRRTENGVVVVTLSGERAGSQYNYIVTDEVQPQTKLSAQDILAIQEVLDIYQELTQVLPIDEVLDN